MWHSKSNLQGSRCLVAYSIAMDLIPTANGAKDGLDTNADGADKQRGTDSLVDGSADPLHMDIIACVSPTWMLMLLSVVPWADWLTNSASLPPLAIGTCRMIQGSQYLPKFHYNDGRAM